MSSQFSSCPPSPRQSILSSLLFCFSSPLLYFLSWLTPSSPFASLPLSSLCPPALLIGWMYNVRFWMYNVRLLGSTACREKARESTCHQWICVSFKNTYADRQLTSSPGLSRKVCLRQLSGMSRGQRQEARERKKKEQERTSREW